jgi:hypothetical protein
MFGDYFKSLSTNQKIMFGVAVFFVVAVIVYLIYKYLFKTAKNFISHYIMHREPFEQVKLVVKSSCGIGEFFDGTNNRCNELPANTVVGGTGQVTVASGTRTSQLLKFAYTHRGRYINSSYAQVVPPANSIPFPVNSSTKTDPLNDLFSLNPASLITSVNEDSTAVSGRVVYNLIGSRTQGKSAPKFSLASSNFPLAISIPSTNITLTNISDDSVITNATGSNTGAVANLYFSFSSTPPDSVNDQRNGDINFYFPLQTVNFYPANQNSLTLTSFPTNFTQNNFVSNSNALTEYSQSFENNNAYISSFQEFNKIFLAYLCIAALRKANAYRSSDPGIFNTSSASYSVIRNTANNIHFLKATLKYECGRNRIEVGSGNCSGSSAVRTFTQFWGENVQDIFTQNGIVFNTVCQPGTNYDVNYGPGSCGQTGCSLGSAVGVYNGLGNSFRLKANTVASPFISAFEVGQTVILPATLTSIGSNTDIPEMYAVQRQWDIPISQFPSIGGQSCSNPSLVANALTTALGETFTYNSNTDDINYTRETSRKVIVTRTINKKYRVRYPLEWKLYAVDTSGNIASMSFSNPTTSLQNPSYVIGAPIEGNRDGAPSFVPVFVASPGQAVSVIFNSQTSSRENIIDITRNIWVGLGISELKNPNGTWKNLSGTESAFTFGDLIRNFVNLAAPNSFVTAQPDEILFRLITGGSYETSTLRWGIPISELQSYDPNNPPRIQNYAYEYYTNITSSNDMNLSNLDFESPYTFYEDDKNNRLSFINNNTIISWSAPTGETLELFRASPTRVVVLTRNVNSLSSRKIYVIPVTATAFGSATELIIPSRSAGDTRTITNITSIDISSDGNRVVAVSGEGDIYTWINAGSSTMTRVSVIMNPTTDSNSFRFVKWADRINTSSNQNLILATFPVSNGGFVYFTTISGSTYNLYRVDSRNNISTNDIRSISLSSTPSNVLYPSKISIAVYNGPIITYNLATTNTSYDPNPDNINVSSIIGKWTSVSISRNNSQRIVACTEYRGTLLDPLGTNDGRIFFSPNGGKDWGIIRNPKKYSNVAFTTTELDRMDPLNASYDKFFNGYNYTSIDFGTDTQIIASYRRAQNPTRDASLNVFVTSGDESIPGSGLLRITLPQ